MEATNFLNNINDTISGFFNDNSNKENTKNNDFVEEMEKFDDLDDFFLKAITDDDFWEKSKSLLRN